MELVKWLSMALVLLLGPVILIHELGHYITARMAGVRILEAGIGYPPRLLTLFREPGVLRVNGVEMTLPRRVRLPRRLEVGEQVEVQSRVGEDGTRYALRIERLQPSPDRSGAIVEEERYVPWTEERPEQDEGGEGDVVRGPLQLFEPGTIYSLNLLPLGGFVRMLGEEDPSDPRSLAAKPKRWRLLVLLSGAMVNILAALILMTTSYLTGVPQRFFVQIEQVIPDTAAEAIGLQAGDVVRAVGGELLEGGPNELHERIQALEPGDTIFLELLRGDEERTVEATLGSYEGHAYLGIYMQPWADAGSLASYSLPRAVVAAGDQFVQVFAQLFHLPRAVAQGEVSPAEVRPGGLPAILQWLGLSLKNSVEWGIAFPALQFTAMVSLAIGMTNLLPLPALDGGRALFVLIEAVRGRRISPATEGMIHLVGMAVLLILSAIIMFQDIVNPLVPWSVLGR